MSRSTKMLYVGAVVTGLSLGFAGTASAQALDGFQLNRYEPTAAGEWSFAVDHPWYSATRRWAAGVTLNYAHRPLVVGLLRNGSFEPTRDLVQHQLIGNLGGAVSFLDRVLVTMNLPITLLETGEAGGGATVGDPRVGALVRAWGQPMQDKLSISAGANIWVPLRAMTNSIPATASDQQVRLQAKVVFGGVWRSLLWSATGAFLFRQESALTQVAIGSAELGRAGSELQVGLAGAYYNAEKRFSIGPELILATTVIGQNSFSRFGTSLELLLGAHHHLAKLIQVGAAVGTGFVREPGTPDFRMLLRVAYAPSGGKVVRAADSDGDGIVDGSDACPNEKGVRSSDPAMHGCPAKVLVLDTDRDGVPDKSDQCPDVPMGKAPDPERLGCPAPPPADRDKDGVIDKEDMCPDLPKGQEPDPGRLGCPAQDSDKDGVFDPSDQCLFDPAGLFPDPDKPGCPLPDRDGDQVPDPKDACPTKPGAPHPDPKKSGCPGLVEVKNGQIMIMRPVFFAPGKDTILQKSYLVLQAVADALMAVPTIKKVQIEGHTDNAGKLVANVDLSERRARSVQRWLVSRGVGPERLSASGFGPTRPIASNKTAAGKAKNRRVEFHILDNHSDPAQQSAGAESPAQSPAQSR